MKNSKFIQKIRNFIEDKELLDQEGKYLVALSGGADSVTLLLVLQELGYQTEACHCNFQLRGEESNRDEQFCVNLCERLNIPLHRIHFDTKMYAQTHKVSIEMAARDLRYKYFNELMQDLKADGICVAHHQDDNVETVLINLIRGTGIKGLAGISAKNGNIIRPLLCVTRKEILAYLDARKQDYVTDSTNLVDDVVRNKIRLNVIPMLQEINPAVCQNIARTARYMEGLAQLQTQHVEKLEEELTNEYQKPVVEYGGITEIDDLFLITDRDMVLYEKLKQFDFTGDIVDEIGRSLNNVGKEFDSRTHRLVIGQQALYIESFNNRVSFKPRKLPEPGLYSLPPKSILIPVDNSPVSKFASEDIVNLCNKRRKRLRELDAEKDRIRKEFLMEIEEDYQIPIISLLYPKKERQKIGEIRDRKVRRYNEYLNHEQKIRISIFDNEEEEDDDEDEDFYLPEYCIWLDADVIKFPLTLRTWKQGDRFSPFGMKGTKLVSNILNDAKLNLFQRESQLVLEDATGEIIWVVGIRSSNYGKITDDTKQILEVKLEVDESIKDIK